MAYFNSNVLFTTTEKLAKAVAAQISVAAAQRKPEELVQSLV